MDSRRDKVVTAGKEAGRVATVDMVGRAKGKADMVDKDKGKGKGRVAMVAPGRARDRARATRIILSLHHRRRAGTELSGLERGLGEAAS